MCQAQSGWVKMAKNNTLLEGDTALEPQLYEKLARGRGWRNPRVAAAPVNIRVFWGGTANPANSRNVTGAPGHHTLNLGTN